MGVACRRFNTPWLRSRTSVKTMPKSALCMMASETMPGTMNPL